MQISWIKPALAVQPGDVRYRDDVVQPGSGPACEARGLGGDIDEVSPSASLLLKQAIDMVHHLVGSKGKCKYVMSNAPS